MTTIKLHQHQQILSEFLNSNIKIKSIDKLNDYITFCIENNQNERILNEDKLSKTSYHHILPKAKDCFPTYGDLKVNDWNGTHLLYSDHYYAHWLITEAIDSYSQLHAFCAMHYMDTKKDRILESDLIPANEFQKKMEDRSKHQRLFMQSEAGVSASKKHSKTKQSREWKEHKGKEAKLKEHKTKSSKEWQENVWKPAIEKRLELMKSKEWREGVGKEAKLKISFTKSNGKAFNIYRNNELLFENIMSENIIKISKALRNATVDRPIGSNRLSKLGLNKLKKLYMIGMYVEEITINSYKDINILESID